MLGDHWNHIKKPEKKIYLKNAYRVLLTRARQGMVIVVPEGARKIRHEIVSFMIQPLSIYKKLVFKLYEFS